MQGMNLMEFASFGKSSCITLSHLDGILLVHNNESSVDLEKVALTPEHFSWALEVRGNCNFLLDILFSIAGPDEVTEYFFYCETDHLGSLQNAFLVESPGALVSPVKKDIVFL